MDTNLDPMPMESSRNLFDRDTADALEVLLLGLPLWADPQDRMVFVQRALWNHPALLDRLRLDGNAAQAAGTLVVALGRDLPPDASGQTPLCALLVAIRKTGLCPPAKLDPLLRQFGCEPSPDARPLAIPGGGSPAGALALWREKLAFLLQQEAVAADPAQKFQLHKAIEECRAKIRALGGEA